MPWALYVGRICEAFNCRPSQALEELARMPAGWLDEIIEARAFADTWSLWDQATDKAHVPDTPMMALVKEIEFACVAEDREKVDTPDA